MVKKCKKYIISEILKTLSVSDGVMDFKFVMDYSSYEVIKSMGTIFDDLLKSEIGENSCYFDYSKLNDSYTLKISKIQ